MCGVTAESNEWRDRCQLEWVISWLPRLASNGQVTNAIFNIPYSSHPDGQAVCRRAWEAAFYPMSCQGKVTTTSGPVYLRFGFGSEFLKLAPFLENSPPKTHFYIRGLEWVLGVSFLKNGEFFFLKKVTTKSYPQVHRSSVQCSSQGADPHRDAWACRC